MRDFGWALRGLEEAETVFTQTHDGRLVMELSHPVVPGVTAEMVAWWFGVYAHLKLKIDGETHLAFLVWHPRDHAYIERVGGETKAPLKAGDRIAFQEAYGRNTRYSTDETLQVLRRTPRNYAIRSVRLGLTVAQLEHSFQDTDSGVQVMTRLCIGVPNGWAKTLINQVFIPVLFDEKKTEAWMQHNVEEISAWAHFLPDIYARRDQGEVIVWDRAVEES
ncbi:hypothetical protein [uncultured Shimia sp.]|uniref:DAPG hydrolase family protein n=1 Tax=uncultured Shimia sp. TaxID=573152 RepID=UPI00261506F3|nr:hypothetical protein [uncultured Shimia sp.]